MGAPGGDEIEIAITVDIVEIGSLAAVEKNRLATDSTKGPRGTIHSAGDEPVAAANAL